MRLFNKMLDYNNFIAQLFDTYNKNKFKYVANCLSVALEYVSEKTKKDNNKNQESQIKARQILNDIINANNNNDDVIAIEMFNTLLIDHLYILARPEQKDLLNALNNIFNKYEFFISESLHYRIIFLNNIHQIHRNLE